VTAARIAVVGDFNLARIAHNAIQQSFALGGHLYPGALEAEWLGTETIVPGNEKSLQRFSGIWCAPGSPYRKPEGALWAIRFARTRSLPFLGTCGGYQHALLEFARNQLKVDDAEHSEDNPNATVQLVYRMPCSLIEQQQEVTVSDQRFQEIYGASSGMEGYHCSYGLNPDYEKLFANTPLHIVARAADGQARAFQLEGNPFFIGTQFQPERRALAGSLHPIVRGFFLAAMEWHDRSRKG
jgi:CTP synthase (UTP-ammonia lyase)